MRTSTGVGPAALVCFEYAEEPTARRVSIRMQDRFFSLRNTSRQSKFNVK
jgi:hypothetical protein